ncbi:MAG: glycosyltransferase, partial [Pseudomonadota bacterium]
GIVPVEAMAAGCPVIAYGRGGACDTVIDGRTGVLFAEQTVEALIAGIERFETMRLSPNQVATGAAGFGASRFREAFATEVARAMAAKERAGAPVLTGSAAVDTGQQAIAGAAE